MSLEYRQMRECWWLFLWLLAVPPSPSIAGQDTARWEISFGGGMSSGGDLAHGTGTLPATRAPIVLPSPPPFPDSIYDNFPSWYFAGGAAYLNAGSAALFGRRAISPLDSALMSAGVSRGTGVRASVRAGRELTRRLRAEFDVEHRRAQLTLSETARGQIEASRAGFAEFFTALNAFTAVNSAFTAVNSTALLRSSGGREIVTTGALSIDLRTRGRAIPFVSVGGGVSSRIGTPPSATLTGEYTFRFRGTPPFPEIALAQSDNVTMRYTPSTWAPVVTIRGGVRYRLSRRLVARAEFTHDLLADTLRVRLDARPATGSLNQVQSGADFSFAAPGAREFRLTLRSDPSAPQSLMGLPIENFTTFESSGIVRRFGAAVALGWRF